MEKARIFNEAREAYLNTTLTAKEVKAILSDLPYSKTDLFITVLCENNCIKRISKGKYKFTEDPIHFKLLNKVYDCIRIKNNEYNRKSHNKKTDKRSDIQKAIDLLLSTGEYEIYHIEKVIKKTQIL